MQIPQIERAPVSLENVIVPLEREITPSQQALNTLAASLLVIENTHAIGQASQTRYTENDFVTWLEFHSRGSQGAGYELNRGIGEISLTMGLDGLHRIRGEVDGRDVLEVGPGNGVFARTLSRQAGSLTLVDRDIRVLGLANELGVTDVFLDPIQSAEIIPECFDRVFDISAALLWGADMGSTATALHKELSVTRIGGSLIAVPLFTVLVKRARNYSELSLKGGDISPTEGFRDFRDYVMGRSLLRLIQSGAVEATLGINIWDKAEDDEYHDYDDGIGRLDRYFDSFWGILDKKLNVSPNVPDDLSALGYDLQDGEKAGSTISSEIGISVDKLPLNKLLATPV